MFVNDTDIIKDSHRVTQIHLQADVASSCDGSQNWWTYKLVIRVLCFAEQDYRETS